MISITVFLIKCKTIICNYYNSRGISIKRLLYIDRLFIYFPSQTNKILITIITCILPPIDCDANIENNLIPSVGIINHKKIRQTKKNKELHIINIPLPNKRSYPKNDINKIIDHIAILKEKLLVDRINLKTKIPLLNNFESNSCIEDKFKKKIYPLGKINRDPNKKKNTNNIRTIRVKNKKNYIQSKTRKYLWPVTGDTINFKRNNNGIDIIVDPNTSIKAAEDGIITYVGNDLVELGNIILIRHDNSIVTVYSNVNIPYVKKGQKVSRGDNIGSSGINENTKKHKFHFEVRKNAIEMNPLNFLEDKPYLQKNNQY
ncbi:murein hydrolase activator EnvC family protein [Candidatus Liberibacter brunswickensis]|uniref:murein hydrolase activator EnvC family protein n=1 Tax=Candidatus Liberibacter brunswickensis TaxID=1968796 RepID=UPI002FE0D303